MLLARAGMRALFGSVHLASEPSAPLLQRAPPGRGAAARGRGRAYALRTRDAGGPPPGPQPAEAAFDLPALHSDDSLKVEAVSSGAIAAKAYVRLYPDGEGNVYLCCMFMKQPAMLLGCLSSCTSLCL